LARKERIKQNADKTLQGSALPFSKTEEDRLKSKKPAPKAEEYSFKPGINKKEIDYEKEQLKFQKKLDRKKEEMQKQRSQIEPKSPNFTKKENKGRALNERPSRDYLNEGAPGLMSVEERLKKNLKSKIAQESHKGEQASSTKAVTAAMNKRREEQLAKK